MVVWKFNIIKDPLIFISLSLLLSINAHSPLQEKILLSGFGVGFLLTQNSLHV